MTPDATRTSPPDPTRTAGDGTRTADIPPTSDTKAYPNDGTPAPIPDAPPGFVLDRELGRGGMGVVYLARQAGLNRPVALKLIQSGDTGSVLRFLAEAEAMAAVRHPNVAEVYQFGEHAGRPFLALEFCPGGDLTRLVSPTLVSPTRERGTDANWFRARADLMAKVADGVAAAHAVGIVHRDLKPHNVLLTANGTPKVTDFGLAKREGGSDLTKTTAVMGTPAYMPPEQAKGETKFVGPQADVWALGVMLYEALTGTRPFTGADHWAVLAAVQRGTYAPPRAVVPDLPRDLELVCLKCLKADPQDRYPTAAELAADLRNWLDGKPISARPAGLIEQAAKWAKRNKRLASMGAAVLLTMAVATAVSFGFGLDANTQRKNAEDKTAEVKVEKDKVTTALDDLSVANEKTQRTLARALMAPVATENAYDQFGEYEREAFWQLTQERNGPVGLMLVEHATTTPSASSQLRKRARVVVHAAVGLDTPKWVAAKGLLSKRVRDTSLAFEQRWELALTCVELDHLEPADALFEVLTKALNDPIRGSESAAALATVVPRIPAEKATAVLSSALGLSKDDFERAELAKGLAVAAGGLSAEAAVGVCGNAAELLLAELTAIPTDRSGPQGSTLTFRDDGLGQLAVGLAAVVSKLPPERAAEFATKASKALLELALKGSRSERLTIGLAALAHSLPADRAADVCGRVADVLVKELARRVPWASLYLSCAERLATVAARLPAEKRKAVCELGAKTMLATFQRWPRETVDHDVKPAYASLDFAKGLATLAGHLPPESVADTCKPALERLAADFVNETDHDCRNALAQAVSVIANLIPGEQSEWVRKILLEDFVPGITAEGRIVALHTSRAFALPISGFSYAQQLHYTNRTELAALTGVITLHPDVLPKPRPLPPQQLVELLKHPFCVKEARRAVLDALEFTYDRKFAEVWDFVAFAETEHPELDLLTPPKRPER